MNQDPPAPAETIPQDAGSPAPVVLQTPVDIRSASLAVLAVIAVLAVLHVASGFFIPVMVGLMLSYALSPMVDALERIKVPRSLGAAVLIAMVLGIAGTAVYSLADDAEQWLDSMPEAAEKLRETVRRHNKGPATPLESVQEAAAKLERVAEEASAKPDSSRGVQRVTIEEPRFNIRDHVWSGTLGLLALVGQVTLVTFLTYFLLLSGDTFRRKLVKIAGPGFTTKKITVQALDEITTQIQRYLLVQLFVGLLVGVATGLSFWALGLNHAAMWGVAAGVLNLIPYIGSFLVSAAASIVAFLQFGEMKLALAVGGASVLINTLEGNLITPWLTSKGSNMSPVVVFVGVLAWGWLWGVWGLLLGIPIMMVVKAICDRVDDLKPIGELLGD